MKPAPMEVVAPLLNVNEPEARVVEVSVREGDRVEAGAVLCALETTKAAAEVTAPVAGFVRALSVEPGRTIAPEQRICVLTASPDEAVPERPPHSAPPTSVSGDQAVPPGARITRAALALARELGLDLSALPVGPIITERDVRARAGSPRPDASARAPSNAAPPAFDNRIVVFGGGGHGRALLDLLARDARYRVAGVVDDGLPEGTRVGAYAVVGARGALAELAAEGVRLAANGVGGIRSIADRVEAFGTLAEAGFAFPALVHHAAVVEGSAAVEEGAQIFANTYVGSACRVGRGAIVNTGATLSHDCAIGEYAHVAPAAVLAGGVDVGARALVGMGVLIALGLRIGSDARIGNGAVVNADVPNGAVVAAGSIWPRR